MNLWNRVEKTDTCWLWTGYIARSGYGQICIDGRLYYTHRVSWELHNGTIPDGLVVDHLCRVKHCVNPAHMELVTIQENTRRGALGFALTGRCRSGRHEVLTDDDVVNRKGGRRCRQCVRESRDRENVKRNAKRRAERIAKSDGRWLGL